MKIRTKIAFQFTLIVAMILILFSLSLFFLIRSYTKQEFTNYLKDRAETTAALLISENNVDKRLLKIIDHNTLSTLYAAEVLVFNEKNEVSYSNLNSDRIVYSPALLEQIRKSREYEGEYKDMKVVGLMYYDNKRERDYLVLAQATDTYGEAKLENIKQAMIQGLVLALLITVILSFSFAGYSLRPIARINREVSQLSGNDFKKKLSTGNNKDEIAQLAKNFNQMLSRIENSLAMQKSFVSNASHELRTPLAAMKSEIQIALEKERTPEEYKEILESLNQDNYQLIQLTNSLMQLAKSEQDDEKILEKDVRVDELLFDIQEEFISLYPKYKVVVDYEDITENEEYLTVRGNPALLRTLFHNLFENACKYSPDNKAEVKIGFNPTNIIVGVMDKGEGIPESEQTKIFQPFYRSGNASSYKGHGIGLSICKRITELHKGKLVLRSKLGKGSTFLVIIPHL